jgi:hypothetical protein
MAAIEYDLPAHILLKILHTHPPPDINRNNNLGHSAFSMLLDKMHESNESIFNLTPVFEKMITLNPSMSERVHLWYTILYQFPYRIAKPIIDMSDVDGNFLYDSEGIEFPKRTPLMFAIEKGSDKRIIKAILEKPQNFDRVDAKGNTALMYALKHNEKVSEDIIEYLILHTNVNIRNDGFESAFYFAIEYVKTSFVNKVIEQLLNKGYILHQSEVDQAQHNSHIKKDALYNLIFT